MKCRICHTRLDPILEDVGTHPYCEPVIKPRGEQLEMKFASAHPEEDPFAVALKRDLIEIIKWKDKGNPRSHQVNIGPSELSSPCDRRVGYRLAGIPQVNTTLDPWPAIVGTAVHDWLDKAVQSWNGEFVFLNGPEWLTEERLTFSEWVTGKSDLFHVPTGTVIDWKGTSPDKMKKILKEGSPENYKTQIQIYGWGYQQLGFNVKRVALAYFPRAGNIKDLHVETFEFDPTVGPKAVARVPAVAEVLVNLEVFRNPHRWEQVDSFPSHDCGFCPWYNPRRSSEQGASNEGCPGNRSDAT
jgi:hypothetical protein